MCWCSKKWFPAVLAVRIQHEQNRDDSRELDGRDKQARERKREKEREVERDE